jgi:hypothetical protein
MNLTVQFFSRGTSLSAARTRPAEQPFRLTRTFVETGDERCPIAGIWSRIECGPIAPASQDEPELPRPAIRRLLSWRAFYTLLTVPRYSLA